MTKGRRFNPPLDKDGLWFPHAGLPQKMPESLTKAMLREPYSPQVLQQMQGKLPPIYQIREKQPVNTFPFSLHDNRYSLKNSCAYLDSGLGLKKFPPEKRQHLSTHFNIWASDYVPSHLDGLSNNQISYTGGETTVVSIFRRFPRRYSEMWNSFKFLPQESITEFLETNPELRFSLDGKASTPRKT